MTNDDLLSAVTAIAREAGDAILMHYRTATPAAMKEDRSPLTAADLAAHTIICAGLAAISPLPVISEEAAAADAEVRSGWTAFWLVDPLDGTKEYLKQSGEFTVNIALVENGYPTLGVVYAPVLDALYSAALGNGSRVTRDGITRVIHAATTAARPARVAVSRDHAGSEEEAIIERLGGAERVPCGSSLKFCAVAEAQADLYPRPGPTMEWDTAAAQCVVEEAGGRVVDAQGARLRYNKDTLRNPAFFVFADEHLFEVAAGLEGRLRA